MAKAGQLKTVLITGGTNGLGKATAIRLAEEGYHVVVTGRNAERRAAVDALARERGLPLSTVGMDVCDEASVERGLAEAREKLRIMDVEFENRKAKNEKQSGGEPPHSQAGDLPVALTNAGESGGTEKAGIDVLINNAGVGYYAVMEEITMEDLRQQMETNFFAAVRMTQRVLPEMRARNRGRIINISSIAGKFSFALFGPYSASKYALEAMSDALRMEVRPLGIDVVVIEPGFIPTGFQARAHELASRYIENAERSPYARLYKNYGRSYRKSTARVTDTPEDCARVVLRALRAERPKARYTVTRRAAVVSFVKRFLPDAFLDWRVGTSLGWR